MVAPGHYTLLAKVSNRDGVWSPDILEVDLEVVPAFYRTVPFLLLVAAGAALLPLGLGAWIARQRYRRRLERWRFEQRREEDRRRISRDLHDDLGAGLTQIVLLSEKEKRRAAGDPGFAYSARIADDGRGFLVDGVEGGRGLRNLRDRARAVGGELTVSSAPGRGTRICVKLPIGSGEDAGPGV